MDKYKFLVSSEVAIMLKDMGFNDICGFFYSTATKHNGNYIDFDEECELKAEGRENEIERVPFGKISQFTCINKTLDTEYAVACPDIYQVMDWFRTKYNVYFTYDIFGSHLEPCFVVSVKKFNDGLVESVCTLTSLSSYEETFNKAIKLAIEYVKCT